MTIWMKDAAAGVGVVVFMAFSFVLANAAQAMIATS